MKKHIKSIRNKKNIKIPIRVLIIALVIFTKSMYAQQPYLISGEVIDTTKKGVPGINVQVKGTINATSTNADGKFTLKTTASFPFTLVFAGIGYGTRELEIKDKNTSLVVAINTQSELIDEVVVSASRIAESQLKSPVSIEKLDIRAIKESATSSFYDAIENIKGVQFTTLSLGFKVPNTRGFNNTNNYRFLQLVDGADNQSPGLGSSIANAVGPNELDIQSVELIPGASSALYGMNGLNGLTNLKTKSPFTYKGLSVYQKTAVNHVDGNDHAPSGYTETALRYANTIGSKFGFKINGSFTQGTDWIANNRTDINPTANQSLGLTGANNPGYDGVNTYGDENGSDTKTLTLGGKKYVVARTGYAEKDLSDNSVKNIKGDASLYYKLNDKNEISYTYRIGDADNTWQRGNRIRLQDYIVQQHKLEINNPKYFFRTYYTEENTGNSYALRPLAENLNKAFKSDTKWYNDYTNAFNSAIGSGNSVAQSLQVARTAADYGRFQPGTDAFNNAKNSLVKINNWDNGAALVLKNSLYHAEGQYDFSKEKSFVDLLVGGDFRDYFIYPDGNSFINPVDPGQNFQYYRGGGFAQLSKRFFKNKLKVLASARVDKVQYFQPVVNPRAAIVYTLKEKHNFRLSYQNGYRFPSLFEAFSYVNNGGVRRIGGLPIMSQNDQIFENSYTSTSVTNYVNAVNTDVNSHGLTQAAAINKEKGLLSQSTYTYIKPEYLNSVEFGYKSILFKNKLIVDLDAYYSSYQNFIGYVDVYKPNKGTIGKDDSTANFAYNNKTQSTKYRMYTNAQTTVYNQGASLGLTYNFYKTFTVSANASYAQLITNTNDALVAAFNTPKYITNVSFGNRELFKNFGFNVTWRWQDAFYWQSPLANGNVSAYNTIDAQVNYRIPKFGATVKVGGTNLANNQFVQYVGGPTIGGFYYTAISFEGLLNK